MIIVWVFPCCVSARDILAGPGRQKQLKLCTVQQIKYNLAIKIFCLVSVQLIISPVLLTRRSAALTCRNSLCQMWVRKVRVSFESCELTQDLNKNLRLWFYQLNCLPASSLAGLPPCLPACLFAHYACLLACFLSCLPAFLLACQLACWLFACLLACMPACLLDCLRACLLAYLLTCLPASLPACLLA